MEATIASAVGAGGVTQKQDQAPAANRRSVWGDFRRELTRAMLMLDLMGYGWYWQWTQEAGGPASA